MKHTSLAIGKICIQEVICSGSKESLFAPNTKRVPLLSKTYVSSHDHVEGVKTPIPSSKNLIILEICFLEAKDTLERYLVVIQCIVIGPCLRLDFLSLIIIILMVPICSLEGQR